MLLGRFEGFEHVDLAGKLEGVAESSIGVQHDRAGRRELAARMHAAVDEVHFAQLFAPTVKPNIERAPAFTGSHVRVGHDNAVRLHGAVDPRYIAAHHESRGRIPGSIAGEQLFRSAVAFQQQRLRPVDVGRIEKFVVSERVVNGFLEHLHVGQQASRARRSVVGQLL